MGFEMSYNIQNCPSSSEAYWGKKAKSQALHKSKYNTGQALRGTLRKKQSGPGLRRRGHLWPGQSGKAPRSEIL